MSDKIKDQYSPSVPVSKSEAIFESAAENEDNFGSLNKNSEKKSQKSGYHSKSDGKR